MDVAVRLFGRAEVSHDGMTAPLRLERRGQLLAYLALRCDWVRRDELAALFWPAHDQSSARRNLRKVLHDAQALPWAQGVEVQDERVRWQVASDVKGFERALAEGRIDEALSLASGSLLDGLDDPGNPAYSEWLHFERARLADRRRSAALRHLDALAPGPSLALAEQLLADEPLDEDLVAARLRALLKLGRRREAQRAYAEYTATLAETLGTDPSANLRALAAAIDRGAAGAPPAPAAADVHAFFGRDEELQELRALLARPDCRLLVVTGPGGIGKSRLVKAALPSLEPGFPDGVGWIPLEDLTDTAEVAPRIAQLLDIPFAGADDTTAHVVGALRRRQALLVLDNIEHLEGLPALIARLLGETSLKLLATSRRRPGVTGEWLLPLQGLSVPSRDDDPKAAAYDAAALFVARARAVQPGFNATPHTAHIAALVRALGGMPLAIELAANWVRLLPVAELAAEVQGSLELLARDEDGEDRPEHRSVRATFEQSWRLLAPAEAHALAGLSVFVGGFALPAARAVADASVPLLAALADKSLLRVEPHGERSRFSQHPLLRQFSAERLALDAPAEAAAYSRHAGYYGRWLAGQTEALRGADQAEVLTAIDGELPNCTSAWQWAVAQGDAGIVAGAAIALMYYFDAKGRRRDGLALFRAARERFAGRAEGDAEGADGRGAALAVLAQAISTLSYRGGDLADATEQATHGIALARRHGVGSALKGCLLNLGLAQWQRGAWDDARDRFDEALKLAREDGDEHGIGVFVSALAMVLHDRGEYVAAEAHYREALSHARRRNNARLLVTTLNNLGQVLVLAGRPADALPVLDEGLQRSIDDGIDVMQSQFLLNLGNVHEALGRTDEAFAFAQRALGEQRQRGEPQAEVESLALLSRLQLRRGQIEAAHRSAHDALRLALELDAEPLQAICLLALADVIAARDAKAPAMQWWARVAASQAAPAAVQAQAHQRLSACESVPAVSDAPVESLVAAARRALREHAPTASSANAG
jgi:predicted ATPase/DNA-binding SARP family transcriptional activator/Tfp pilus assembly protein PilF